MLRQGLLFLLILAACSCDPSPRQDGLAAGNSTPGNSTPAPQPTPTPNQDTALRTEIERIAAAVKGRVGVAAELLETRQAVSINPHDRFPMQSVYKLPIGMAVLDQVDKGKLRLEQTVRVEKTDFVRAGQHSPIRDKNPNGVELTLREVLRFAVSESDGTASDVLMRLVGVDVVSKYLNELGVNELVVANTEKEIGQDWETQYRNWASPDGALQLLKRLHERRGISAQHQELLLKFMTETPTGPRRLKGLLPKTAVVAHKTGTSGSANGITAATNDIGIIILPTGQHVAIAVFVSDSPADVATRERVIARIAKAIFDKWSD